MALSPAPITWLAAQQSFTSRVLAGVGVVLMVASLLALHVRTDRLRAEQRHRQEQAEQLERLERALELVWGECVDLECRRGLAELEQWRRSTSW